jgi:hypothetical protein
MELVKIFAKKRQQEDGTHEGIRREEAAIGWES